jgi:hypothetical protein
VVKRIVTLDPKSYALAYEALATFRAPKNMEDAHADAMVKMESVGRPKAEPTPNPDLVLRETLADVTCELLESERDIVLAALDSIQWPGFALALKRRAVTLLKNAQAIEV